jgi:hypothetical protein
VSGRCSPTEALNILRPAFKDVVAAADKLTQETHAGLNLYVNDQKVHPGFLPHILVVGECQPDGEWIARVTSTVKIGGIGPSDQCEFEVDQVKALRPQPDTRAEAVHAAAAAEAATAEAATARAELEQARAVLEAATEQMEKAEARAQAAEARIEATTDHPPRRRPGPQAEKDWPKWVEHELIRCALNGEKVPTPAKMCERCDKALGYQPDIRAMQRLYRELRRL